MARNTGRTHSQTPKRETCFRGHYFDVVGWHEDTKTGRLRRTCKACMRERAKNQQARRRAKARRFKLPATDPRAVSYRLEAARRGIVLKECA
jgi:hypothetical protein